jgi:hypothetical protein
MRRLLPAALLTCLAATAQAESCTSDPAAFARGFFESHRDFYADYSLAGPEVVGDGLRALLLKEFECAAQVGICNLEADPWTAAQDGEIGEPLVFKASGVTESAATVTLSYLFVLDADGPGVPREARLKLVRAQAGACWQVADLITPAGESLAALLARPMPE